MKGAVNVSHLYLNIKNKEILHDISLDLEPGHILGLIGRNGSGKTMLMKCICGFIKPTSGDIYVDDKKIGKDVDFAPNTGIIIETPGFLPHLSGYQNLKMLSEVSEHLTASELENVMRTVGLDPKLKLPVKKYSLGMRQRLGLAQAIMGDPDILILDEPFNGLDQEGLEDMRAFLLSYKKKGKLILLSSHSKEDISILCDQVFEMSHGRFVNDMGETCELQ